MGIVLLAMPALAAEEAKPDAPKTQEVATEAAPPETPTENPGRLAPDFCDFEITFPEKPYLAQKCLPDGSKCYNLHSYTMVYDLQTTVDVSVTCNPSNPAEFKRYNEAVMKAALTGMISQRDLDQHQIQYREDKVTRSASLSGTGKTGAQDKIFTAQIWAGQNSLFTVQAELIGGQHEQADAVFSAILKSIKLKEAEKPEAAAKQ